MDGLTISNSETLLKTGQTVSEIRDQKMRIDSGKNAPQGSFVDTLNQAIHKVNDLQKDADKKAQLLATGQSKNIPEVMIAQEKAGVAFKLMVQVRNKIIDTYQEIMKMQV